ncbi:MAG: family 78 glycoside hydrolase catalytic domain [Opitutales bacterium]
MSEIPDHAQFVWSDAHGQGRHRLVIFRRTFELSRIPASGEIGLFADTRYRLRVNGEVVSYGPGRFFVKSPQYDRVPLAARLCKGANVLTVEVLSRGSAGSYESAYSCGGFKAWGSIQDDAASVDLATPGEWRCLEPEGWDHWSEPFSFAQGPVEIVDLSQWDRAWFTPGPTPANWSTPVPHEDPNHWGALTERTLPLAANDLLRPTTVLLESALDDDEHRYGLRLPFEASKASFYDAEHPRQDRPQRAARWFTHLHSPRDQSVTVGLFWGPNYLNGKSVEGANRHDRGNRQDFTLNLRKGWNFLYGEPRLLFDAWMIQLGLPKDAGLQLRALPDENCPHAFFRAKASHEVVDNGDEPTQGIPDSLHGIANLDTAWEVVTLPASPVSPAREMAWDRPPEHVAVDAPEHVDGRIVPLGPDGSGTLTFDLGREFLGRVVLDIEAPAGTTVDIAQEERLSPANALRLYSQHWGVSSADRFIHPGGRFVYEGLLERGGRYLQITVRNATDTVMVHAARIRSSSLRWPVQGRFESPDSVFVWTWEASQQTLECCTNDVWLDCPWRERGMYLGDALVEAAVQRAYNADLGVHLQVLRLFADSQRADGQMPPVGPGNVNSHLLDYTVLWVHVLYDYWNAGGQLKDLARFWPALEKVLYGSFWNEAENGLWQIGPDHRAFVDHSANVEQKIGQSTPLNAFRFRALQMASEMALALGRKDEAQRHHVEAEKVRAGFQTLWLSEAGRFAASRIDGNLSDARATHANILALLYGLAEEAQIPSALEYVKAELDQNLRFEKGHVELYFLYFAFEMLYTHGEAGYAEELIRSHFGLMQRKGAWTVWECICRGLEEKGSYCHAWSCAPVAMFATQTLGVTPAEPGNAELIRIAPNSDTLEWARGSVPHPRGPVIVDWRIEGELLFLHASLPPGTRAQVEPRGRLSGLKQRFQLQERPG